MRGTGMAGIQKRYIEIDSLKGFAAFLVVLGHAIIYFPINLHENVYCENLFRLLSSIHLPLFFCVAGFCFSYRENYGRFLVKKITRLLVPYFAFNLIDLIPRAILPQFVNRPQGVAESIRDILLYGGEYWFLFALFMIFAIYPVIYRWQTGSQMRKIVVAVCLCVLAVVKIPTKVFTLDFVSYYLVFFNLGVLLKTSYAGIFDFKLSKSQLLMPIGFVILWIGLLFSPWGIRLELVVSLLGVAVCYFLTKLNVFNVVFERFGKFSLQLYLLNGFLLVISRTIICSVSKNPFVIICFNMIVDFGLSYLAIKYIGKRFTFIRVLMGMD